MSTAAAPFNAEPTLHSLSHTLSNDGAFGHVHFLQAASERGTVNERANEFPLYPRLCC